MEKLESFGEFLKKERKMRAMTLEEISSSTNVNVRFFEYIENDNYENLPADVFVRGFIKAYSEAIGIDPNDVLLAYTEFLNYDSGNNLVKKEKDTDKNKNRLVFFICIIIAGLFLIFYYHQAGQKKQSIVEPLKVIKTLPIKKKEKLDHKKKKVEIEKEISKKVTEKKSIKTEPSPTTIKQLPTIEKNLPVKEETPEGQSKKTAFTNTDELILTVYASEKVWMTIIVDDGEPKEALLNPGEKWTHKATNQFLLTLGNVSGSIVTFNGKELTIPASRYNIVRDFVVDKKLLLKE